MGKAKEEMSVKAYEEAVKWWIRMQNRAVGRESQRRDGRKSIRKSHEIVDSYVKKGRSMSGLNATWRA